MDKVHFFFKLSIEFCEHDFYRFKISNNRKTRLFPFLILSYAVNRQQLICSRKDKFNISVVFTIQNAVPFDQILKLFKHPQLWYLHSIRILFTYISTYTQCMAPFIVDFITKVLLFFPIVALYSFRRIYSHVFTIKNNLPKSVIRLCYLLKHPHIQITSFVQGKILQQKINLQEKK